jgi:hypothetical protein
MYEKSAGVNFFEILSWKNEFHFQVKISVFKPAERSTSAEKVPANVHSFFELSNFYLVNCDIFS